MTVFLAIVCICLLIPILSGVALIITGKVVFQRELPPTRKVIDAWVKEGPAPGYHRQWQERLRKEWPTLANALDEASGVIPMVPEPVEDMGKRYKLLDEQDWEYKFRQLNGGKPWDYTKPSNKPLRRIIGPDGSITEIHSMQSYIHSQNEEMICNPCARNDHRRCVAGSTNPNDWDSCYCDCIVDEDDA